MAFSISVVQSETIMLIAGAVPLPVADQNRIALRNSCADKEIR